MKKTFARPELALPGLTQATMLRGLPDCDGEHAKNLCAASRDGRIIVPVVGGEVLGGGVCYYCTRANDCFLSRYCSTYDGRRSGTKGSKVYSLRQ